MIETLLHPPLHSAPDQARDLVDSLRRADPGLLRWTQAVKSVATVAIALAAFHKFDLSTRLLAAIAVAFTLQCAGSGSRRRQALTMFLTGIGIAVATALGALASVSVWSEGVVLGGVAFAVFYARRFLIGGEMFPIYAFILCVITMEMPGGRAHLARETLAVASGIPIALAMYFGVLPPDPRRAFAAGLRDGCIATSRALATMSTLLAADADARDPRARRARAAREHEVRRRLRAVAALVKFNQGIVDGSDQKAPALAALRRQLRLEYDMFQALTLLRRAVARMVDANLREPDATRARLADLLGELSIAFIRPWAVAHDRAAINAHREEIETSLMESDHPFGSELAPLFTSMRCVRQLVSALDALAQDAFAAPRSSTRGHAPVLHASAIVGMTVGSLLARPCGSNRGRHGQASTLDHGTQCPSQITLGGSLDSKCGAEVA